MYLEGERGGGGTKKSLAQFHRKTQDLKDYQAVRYHQIEKKREKRKRIGEEMSDGGK